MKWHCITFLLIWLLFVHGNTVAQDSGQSQKGYFDIDSDPRAKANDARIMAQSGQSRILVAKAKLALAKGDTSLAIRLLQQAVAAYPDGGESRLRLAYLHAQLKQPDAVIADLKPIVYPPPNVGGGVGAQMTTRMVYVLALLDRGLWQDAATLYNVSVKPGSAWFLPGGGPSHPFPEMQFRPGTADYQDLRGQAHLILGAYPPDYVEPPDQPAYMLAHIKELLRVFPGLTDGRFIYAILLGKMEKFDEARAAFEQASLNALPARKDEIKKAVQAMEERVAELKMYKARESQQAAAPHH
jgi:tetratricopeptide (TPR) repeat protein